MLLFVGIIMATYTGNMTNFFLKSGIKVHGPKDLNELQAAAVCVPFRGMVDTLEPFVGSAVAPFMHYENEPDCTEDTAACYESRMAFCDSKLMAGEVDAIADFFGSLNIHVLNNCDTLALVPSINILPNRWALFMNNAQPDNYGLILNLSQAITFIPQEPTYYALM